MKINDTFITTLPKISMDGKFHIRYQKNWVFVSQGIENEQAEIQIIKRIKEGFVGKIIRIIKSDEARIKNDCSISQCGGCDYRYIRYEKQLEIKKNQIKDLLLENQLNIQVHDVVGCETSHGYRNKAIYTFQKKKQLQMGFYEENSHYVADIPYCFNHDELTNQIASEIKKLCIQFHIDIYDEDKKTGLLRHVLIRRAIATDQTLVCLVVAKAQFKGSRNFVNELIKRCPKITTVVMNINPRSTSVVLGNEEKVLYGKGFIVDELCHKTYRISASSFYQINHDQTEKLYQKAIELADLKKSDVVYDMYCGIGTIGMSCADQVKEVIGVEINQQAIQDAKINARMNQIKNISFVCEDATSFMNQCVRMKKRVDVVMMDPPRSGSTKSFIESLASMSPKKIVYISCNPATQIRDIQFFAKKGYHTSEMYLFDMFPMSAHVESVVLLSRKKIDSSISK